MRQKTLLYPLLTLSVHAQKNKFNNNNDLFADPIFNENSWSDLQDPSDPWGDSGFDMMGLNIDSWGVDKPIYLDNDNTQEQDDIIEDTRPNQRAPSKPKKTNKKPAFGSLLSHNSRPAKNSTEYTKYAVKKLESKIQNEHQRTEINRLKDLDEDSEDISKEDYLKWLMLQMVAEEVDDREDKIIKQGWGQKSSGGASSSATMTIKEQNDSALSNIGYLLDAIWNYGCWCYFGENMLHGRGVPVNTVDRTCQALNYCYTCVKMDERDQGKVCQPGQVKYNRPTGTNAHEKSQDIACEKNNGDDSCKINTCKCETQFISTLISFFFDPEHIFQPEYKHDLGYFDPGTCGPLPPHIRGLDSNDGNGLGGNSGDPLDEEFEPIEGIGIDGNSLPGNAGYLPENKERAKKGHRQCCGDYPHRKPYNDGFQSCCHNNGKIGKVFLTDERQCCRDGSVKAFCPDYVDEEED